MADTEERAESRYPDEKRKCSPPGSIGTVVGGEEPTGSIHFRQRHEEHTHQTTVEKKRTPSTIESKLLQILSAHDHAIGGYGKTNGRRQNRVHETGSDEANDCCHQRQGKLPRRGDRWLSHRHQNAIRGSKGQGDQRPEVEAAESSVPPGRNRGCEEVLIEVGDTETTDGPTDAHPELFRARPWQEPKGEAGNEAHPHHKHRVVPLGSVREGKHGLSPGC